VPDRQAIGVLGGSFNPPHVAHLAIASDACAQLGLERVLFVPAAAPPHKDIADDVPAAVRLEMTRLAVKGDERFAVSEAEIELGLRFTSDTLAELARRHHGRPLVFIGGSDTLLQFGAWHEPETIVELARLAVAPRPGDDPRAIERAAARWGEGRVVVLSSAALGISSSMIRCRVSAGRPIRYLVPPAIERFIAEHGLYRPTSALMSERQRAERMIMERGLSDRLEAHCRGTALQAELLARRWGASPDDAAVAGLLHDLCRELTREEVLAQARKHGLEVDPIEEEYAVQLLHARVAAAQVAEAGFAPAIAEAIGRHTLAGPGMSVLDTCLFVADATEPGRTWDGVDEMRRLATESLDDAALALVERDLERLRVRGRRPHPLMLAYLEERRGRQE